MKAPSFVLQDFRKESLAQLDSLTPEKVSLFDNNQLISPNFTIVLIPDTKSLKSIISLQNELKEVDPSQYYYSPEELHLTILGNFFEKLGSVEIIHAIKKIVIKNRLTFELYGMGSNQYCGSISAYPTFDISKLRSALRSEIKEQGDNYMEHLPTYEKMGRINIMRYLHQPKIELLKYLRAQADRYFGPLKAERIQLYKNTSKVLAKKHRKLIFEI